MAWDHHHWGGREQDLGCSTVAVEGERWAWEQAGAEVASLIQLVLGELDGAQEHLACKSWRKWKKQLMTEKYKGSWKQESKDKEENQLQEI